MMAVIDGTDGRLEDVTLRYVTSWKAEGRRGPNSQGLTGTRKKYNHEQDLATIPG